MINVLLVDDHNVIRMGMRLIVLEVFFDAVVREAATWPETVNAIDSHPVDLVVLDIDIPGSIGVQMLSVLKAKNPGCKVLILSASDERMFATRYVEAGADGFIQKTASDMELKKAVGDVAAGKVYVSNAVKELFWENRLPMHRRKQASGNPTELLSVRELEVCKLLMQGYRLQEIAEQLHLHHSTVGTYKANAFQKLGVKNLVQLLDKFQMYDGR